MEYQKSKIELFKKLICEIDISKYYHSVTDKKFCKQVGFWLSAKKYEDQEVKIENKSGEVYPLRLKMFKQAIEDKDKSSFITSFANQHFPDVQRAIKEGEITKEDAVKYLNMGNRL